MGYLLMDVLDGCAHVEQVTVHPHHARQGLGRALLGVGEQWASSSGLPALTLTTFTDVPWNAPYSHRLGFRVLDDHELAPGLRQAWDREAARGLDAWPRVAVIRPVETS